MSSQQQRVVAIYTEQYVVLVLWWIILTQSYLQAALGLCRRIRQWYVPSADAMACSHELIRMYNT